MNESQQDVLRVQPHLIPAVRVALADSLDQLNNALLELTRNGYLLSPWLADETSTAVAAHYTDRAMDGHTSSYESLVAYRNELTRVHETLQLMEDHYRRTEGDNAALWGLRA